MKKTILKMCMGLSLVLTLAGFVMLIPAKKAMAATKSYQQIEMGYTSSSYRVKVGDYYFWETPMFKNNKETKSVSVKFSDSKTGTGTEIVKSKAADAEAYGFSKLVTNGNKAYYVKNDTILYSYNLSKKKRTKIHDFEKDMNQKFKSELKTKSSEEKENISLQCEVMTVYDNKAVILFNAWYTSFSNDKSAYYHSKLYVYDLKTEKLKSVCSNASETLGAYSRYVVYGKYDSKDKHSLLQYDIKTGKSTQIVNNDSTWSTYYNGKLYALIIKEKRSGYNVYVREYNPSDLSYKNLKTYKDMTNWANPFGFFYKDKLYLNGAWVKFNDKTGNYEGPEGGLEFDLKEGKMKTISSKSLYKNAEKSTFPLFCDTYSTNYSPDLNYE